ncbi:hypothetical protein [Marinicella sp. W31]|uniref:hypothetical protein n=1 Tax=Marinicella sp. W31 TaxID=3023713 RepID=UPI0037573183
MRYLTVLFVFAFIVLLNGCGSDPLPKEKRLLNSIAAVEAGAEERSLDEVMTYVSKTYSDDKGWGFRDIQRLVQIQIMRYKNLYVLTDVKNVEWLSETEAKVTISVAVAGKPINDASLLESIRADIISFEILMRAEDDIFVTQSATWSRGGLSDFL